MACAPRKTVLIHYVECTALYRTVLHCAARCTAGAAPQVLGAAVSVGAQAVHEAAGAPQTDLILYNVYCILHFFMNAFRVISGPID